MSSKRQSESPPGDESRSQATNVAVTQNGGLLPWLRLLRISALPSAVSNILMAYLLANQTWMPSFELCLLIVASSSLYLGGMVLNDVFDFDVDLIHRPKRPLPSGQISKQAATIVGIGLLVAGVVFASFAGWTGNHGAGFGLDSPFGKSTLIAVLLAICIVLYDGPLKRTILAPGLMGTCRFLNILLGASTFIPLATGLQAENSSMLFGLPLTIWWVATAVGVLVAGVTLLGRREAHHVQPRLPLVIAGVLIIASLIGLAMVVYCPSTLEIPAQTKKVFPLFLGLISLTILRRVVEAVFVATPNKIQAAVISVLRSLIIFDAAICYLVMPHHLGYAIAVLALLVPTILLSKAISST